MFKLLKDLSWHVKASVVSVALSALYPAGDSGTAPKPVSRAPSGEAVAPVYSPPPSAGRMASPQQINPFLPPSINASSNEDSNSSRADPNTPSVMNGANAGGGTVANSRSSAATDENPSRFESGPYVAAPNVASSSSSTSASVSSESSIGSSNVAGIGFSSSSSSSSSSSDTSTTTSSPSLSYAASTGLSGTRGVAMSVTPSTLTTDSSATVSSCDISATLPTGLSLSSSTCVISGTPTTVLASTSFTVTVTDSLAQTTTASVTLQVDEDWSDSDNSSTVGFAEGTSTALTWDSSYLRLTQSGSPVNNAELDATWTPQWASLVSYWKMNNNWNDSKGSNNGTPSGGPTFTAAGRLGSHVGTFVGASSQKVEIASHASVDTINESNFTMMAWMRPTATAVMAIGRLGFNMGLEYGDDTTSRFCSELWDSANVNRSACSAAGYTAGQYYHVVGSIDKVNGTNKLYVNGTLVSTASWTAGTTLRSYATTWHLGSHGTGRYFSGDLDDIALWSTNLSGDEVLAIYERQFPKYAGQIESRVFDSLATTNTWDGLAWIASLPFGKELTGDADSSATITASDSEVATDYTSLTTDTLMSDLKGLWHYNETAATGGGTNDFQDKSGQGNYGEANGTLTFGTNGILGKAARFDGSTAYITYSDSTALSPGAGNMTYAAWFMTPKTYSSAAYIYSDHGVVTNNFAALYVDSTNVLGGRFRDSAAVNVTVLGATTVTDGRWHHGAVVRNGTSVLLYLDGVLANTGTNAALATITLGGGAVATVGRLDSGGNFFAGHIDEVGAWARALSADEIKQLYRRGINRVRLQARSCSTDDCSDDPEWLGQDGSVNSYMTELQNNSAFSATGNPTGSVLTSLPSLLFSSFTSLGHSTLRYFQYRAILESDDRGTGCNYGSGATWCSPELKSVEITP